MWDLPYERRRWPGAPKGEPGMRRIWKSSARICTASSSDTCASINIIYGDDSYSKQKESHAEVSRLMKGVGDMYLIKYHHISKYLSAQYLFG